jgi:hypothetical protein
VTNRPTGTRCPPPGYAVELVGGRHGWSVERDGREVSFGWRTQLEAAAQAWLHRAEHDPDSDARAGEPARRPGRATLFVGHLTLERLLGLPEGLRVTSVSHDFARLGVLLGIEGHSLEVLEEDMVPLNLGRVVVESKTDDAGAVWHRVLLDPT